MNSTFFLKFLIVFLLPASFGLMFSMEQASSDDESGEEKEVLAPEEPKTLMEIAGEQVAKMAVQEYDAKGYGSMEKYLEGERYPLPMDLKIEAVFCSILHDLDRADIFISRLKEIYKKSKEDAMSYFSEFCQAGQKTILAELLNERVLDKELIEYLITNIKDLSLIDYLLSYLPGFKGKRKPRLSKKGRERLRIFKDKLRDKLQNTLQIALQDIGEPLSEETKCSDEIHKIALELESLAGTNPQDVKNKFAGLAKETQNELFKCLVLHDSLQNLGSAMNVNNIFHALFIENNRLRSRDRWGYILSSENIESTVKNLCEILVKFSELYPKVRKFDFPYITGSLASPSYITGNKYIYTFEQLKMNINSLVLELLIRFLKDSQVKDALNLLTYLQDSFTKVKDLETGRYDENYSTNLSFLSWLVDPRWFDDRQDANFFKNFYELFKKLVPNIVRDFKEFTSTREDERQFEVDDWVNRMINIFDIYTDELEDKGFANEAEIKTLTEDFDKEVVGKFEILTK